MQTRNRNTFTTIHTEGALLPADLLQRISENDKSLEGLNPESYHLAPGEKLNEAINRSWNRLAGLWEGFKTSRARLGSNDAGTTLTRERWLLPLFQELGFGRLSITRAIEIDGKSYPISHTWLNVPLHLIGCGLDLDKRSPGVAGASRSSPHSLLQEYLNRSDEAQWGVVSNGLRLRVMRDNATLTRQAYLEFDLESLFDGEVYSDFVLLWLVCHQSRFEVSEKEKECLLEIWSKSAQESGTRALEDLRRGVEDAIVSLGQGFLQHSLNVDLRRHLQRGELSAQDYYRQLLRLVYRLIFLFVAEDRDLLLLPDAPIEARQRYQNYYSATRLRVLAEKQRGSRHHDRYEALLLVISLFGSEKGCHELALPALGSFLFDSQSTIDLNQAKLDNQALLRAVRALAFITDGNTRRAVDFRNLGPEELGSVYESLLELHPLLNTDAGTFELTSAAGNERKTTGSYYTPTSLIRVLLDSALDPVIEDRLKGKMEPAQREQALLDIKVCDPACGSGHFLIAAAHRIAGRLGQVRSGGDEPSPSETRRALRDVIRYCIYGVDINPMAVELCKVNLWLESLEPGKPLSFLDAHIQCGNSLVGVGPKVDLNELEVPDEAFTPVTGDHKPTATLLKKRNKQERAGQESLFVTVINTREDLDKWLAERTLALEAMPEDNAAEVRSKAEAFQQMNSSSTYRKQQQLADLWTSAFFWKMEEPSGRNLEMVAPTNGQLNRLRNGRQTQNGLMDLVEKIKQSEGFFHWPLEFAEVTAAGGFDCVLGNPPWEMLQLEEQEFFASRDPEIAALPGEQRKQAIKKLRETNPVLAQEFEEAKHNADARNKFFREGNRYKFTAIGKMNSYALFAEHFRNLTRAGGRAGVIVPTGIATDDTTKDFFGDLVERHAIASLFDFENKEAIFPGVHRSYKFCLLTLSGAPVSQAQFVFFATRVEHLRDERRRFSLDPAEIALFNPNTRTMPVFRTRADAELTRSIYQCVPVLLNERTGENPWGVSFKQGLFNMTSDSHMFVTEPRESYARLYEGKMIEQYDHRYGNFIGLMCRDNTHLPNLLLKEYLDPYFLVTPWYWVSRDIVASIKKKTKIDQKFLCVYRFSTGPTNARTMLSAIIPDEATNHILPLFYTSMSVHNCELVSIFNSLVYDYCLRLKMGRQGLDIFFVKQTPVLPPDFLVAAAIRFVVPRILELTYTAYDLQPFAEDVLAEVGIETWNGWFPHNTIPGSPLPTHHSPAAFRWDEYRRAILRAELDAYYAALYGLNHKQLRYILDPADLTPRELEEILDPWEEVTDPLDPAGYDARRAASDFPGETFRVLKEKEFKQFGEYRTRRLVLEAWDRLSASGELPEPAYDLSSSPAPVPETITLSSKPSSLPPPPPQVVQESKPKPKPQLEVPPESATQPTFSDFGLYKCSLCGDLIIGFDKQNHEQEKHAGKSVEWKKVK